MNKLNNKIDEVASAQNEFHLIYMIKNVTVHFPLINDNIFLKCQIPTDMIFSIKCQATVTMFPIFI